MPKLETVMVPPWNSCGCNLPSRALAANSLISLLISTKPLRSACGTIGVIRPLSVATATDKSTESYLLREKSKARQVSCYFDFSQFRGFFDFQDFSNFSTFFSIFSKIIYRENSSAFGRKSITHCRIKLPCHDELASGTFFDAKAVALIMKSLNDNFTPSFSNCLLNSARSFDSCNQTKFEVN